LNVASRRPQEWFGFLCGFNSALKIPHEIEALELEYPVKALDDRDTRPQERRFIGDEGAARDITSQRRDEVLGREQDIDDVRVSLFANEFEGIDRSGPNLVEAPTAGQQIGDTVLCADAGEENLAGLGGGTIGGVKAR
jgi:hypothetical protein